MRNYLLAALLLVSLDCLTQAPLVRARAQTQAPTALRFSDIPADFHPWLKAQGVNAENFAAFIQKTNRQTTEREERGEWEHLIYYALQSKRFTDLPPIEPALSAQALAKQLTASQRTQWLQGNPSAGWLPTETSLPTAAVARLKAFALALTIRNTDARLRYFQQFTKERQAGQPALLQAYLAAMRFLYEKEFLTASNKASEVATVYQMRGHSTDTQVEANFAVYQALAALASELPRPRIKRVLVVGPGMDLAPRTNLLDAFGPQSYQPFLLADALLQLGLADPAQLKIDCFDINDRVVAHLRQVSESGAHQLTLLSGLADRAAAPLTQDFKEYFAGLGRGIGKAARLDLPASYAGHLRKAIEVNPQISKSINAARLNVITERLSAAPRLAERPDDLLYDLIVVTNVFPYFNDLELLCALTNLSYQLGVTGYLVHNEQRVTAKAVTEPLQIPVKLTRTVLLAEAKDSPLYDFIAVHQKQSIKKN